MSEKITLSKRDFNRAVLTDVMPYEVPFIVTNEGFYCALEKDNIIKENPFLARIFINNNKRQTRPLIYSILKDSDKDSERRLYLIHPCNQISVCELYKNYRHLIFHMCNKSTFSLRHPSKIADEYYYKSQVKKPEEKFRDEGVTIENEKSPLYASAFFDYKDFSFLYKFYDSYQFHQIEKKFSKLFKFDIAKCFPSISTNELSRSIRGNRNHYLSKDLYSFELSFEEIMSSCNFGDTHGIVIGPEFSRIFAEILLQSIDLKIKKNLSESGIFEGRDYVVKRYVDDYFLFYNAEKIKKAVHQEILKQLEQHKLFSNEAKNIDMTVPFMTGITVAKQKFSDLIPTLFDHFGKIETEETEADSGDKPDRMGITKKILKPHKRANKLITDIKSIVFSNGVTYSNISGYLFTLIRNKVSEIDENIGKINDKQDELDQITNFLLIILDISFFIHAMDFRVRSTFLLSQTIIIINRISQKLGILNSDALKRKIYNESYSSIRNSIQKGTIKDIETLNLIIAIRDIDPNYMLPPEMLQTIILNGSAPSYFSLMTGIYYIRNESSYLELKNVIFEKIISKFNDDLFNIENDSELAHIFFDSIRCPYFSLSEKSQIMSAALVNLSEINEKTDSLMKLISHHNWFIDWSASSSDMIERLLLKKELKTTYES